MNNEPQNTSDDDFQIWIDSLLTSPEANHSATTSLHHRVASQLRHQRRRSLVGKSTAVAAASLALVALFLQPKSLESVDPQVVANSTITKSTIAQPTLPELIVPEQSPAPLATFTARSDMIVVPLESSDPTVTIVRVYPTTITQRRWQREAALQATISHTLRMSDSPINGG